MDERGQLDGGGHPTPIVIGLALIIGILIVSHIDPSSASTQPAEPVNWVEFILVVLALFQLPAGFAFVLWVGERMFREPEDYNTTFRNFVLAAAVYPAVRILFTVGRISAADHVAGWTEHKVYRDGNHIVYTSK